MYGIWFSTPQKSTLCPFKGKKENNLRNLGKLHGSSMDQHGSAGWIIAQLCANIVRQGRVLHGDVALLAAGGVDGAGTDAGRSSRRTAPPLLPGLVAPAQCWGDVPIPAVSVSSDLTALTCWFRPVSSGFKVLLIVWFSLADMPSSETTSLSRSLRLWMVNYLASFFPVPSILFLCVNETN